MFYLSALKIKILLVPSIDHHEPDPGGQATFCVGHKITGLIWPVGSSKDLSVLDIYKVIRTKIKIAIFVLKIHYVTLIQWFHK